MRSCPALTGARARTWGLLRRSAHEDFGGVAGSLAGGPLLVGHSAHSLEQHATDDDVVRRRAGEVQPVEEAEDHPDAGGDSCDGQGGDPGEHDVGDGSGDATADPLHAHPGDVLGANSGTLHPARGVEREGDDSCLTLGFLGLTREGGLQDIVLLGHARTPLLGHIVAG